MLAPVLKTQEQTYEEEVSMTQTVFCTVSSPEQANLVQTDLRRVGYRPDELVFASEASAVENIVHPETDLIHSTKFGIVLGFVVGSVIGAAQLLFYRSATLHMPGLAACLPLGSGLGWAAYGAILGVGGIFSRHSVPAEVEHRYEEEVGKEKMLVAVPVHSPYELDILTTSLVSLGASNITAWGRT